MDCSRQSYSFNTDFCLQMTNQVLLKQVNKGLNFVLSPLSFHVMLSLIAAGSKGKTLKQLLSSLGENIVSHLSSSSAEIINLTSPTIERNNSAGGPTLSFVNGAWLDYRFVWKPSFKAFVKDVYKAKLKEVDFANEADGVIDLVNSSAERSTEGLIKQLLQKGSFDGETVLVPANALYFKGLWDKKFDLSRTKYREFHLLNRQIVQAPFMTSKRYEQHFHGSFDGFKVLHLPYQSGRDTRKFSMCMFLPDKKDGLPNLIQRFNSDPGFFNQYFKLVQEDIEDFWIPRFKFSFEFEASETMQEMGLELPFMKFGAELNKMADSLISNMLYVYVSGIFQKSYIEVSEEGTEAAASTAALTGLLCARWPTATLVADHPFMFMIREETSGPVFFTEAVLNPLLED